MFKSQPPDFKQDPAEEAHLLSGPGAEYGNEDRGLRKQTVGYLRRNIPIFEHIALTICFYSVVLLIFDRVHNNANFKHNCTSLSCCPSSIVEYSDGSYLKLRLKKPLVTCSLS